VRSFVLVSLLMAAVSARAQGTPSPEAPAPAATPPEVPSQGPVSPLPEATPPLVPAPAPELVFPPLISHPPAAPLRLWPGERLRVETLPTRTRTP